tara:strand:- start:704 stop:1594 length:891 start_codon:yes stop_codon:yes gene_type:complete
MYLNSSGVFGSKIALSKILQRRISAITLATVSVCVLAACATAPTNLALEATVQEAQQIGLGTVGAEDAILLVAVGPISIGGTYEFRRIDEDGLGFAADPVVLGFGTWGIGDKMQRPADDKSSFWLTKDEVNFLIKKIPAGRYAATKVSWNISNGISSGTAWKCRRDGAATFDIKPGTIALVSSRDALPAGVITRLSNAHSDEEVLAQFERTRTNYPKLIGEPVETLPEWITSWSAKTGWFSDGCNSFQKGTMTLTPIHMASDDSAPDDLERSVIAKALENLKAESAQPSSDEEAQK